MKRIAKPLLIAALALGTSACVTTPRAGPTDVTRYHLGSEQIRPGSFAVEPLSTTGTMSLEYQAYGDAVASLETGTGPAFDAAHSLYRRFGFTDCGAFGDYSADDPFSRFMSRVL